MIFGLVLFSFLHFQIPPDLQYMYKYCICFLLPFSVYMFLFIYLLFLFYGAAVAVIYFLSIYVLNQTVWLTFGMLSLSVWYLYVFELVRTLTWKKKIKQEISDEGLSRNTLQKIRKSFCLNSLLFMFNSS